MMPYYYDYHTSSGTGVFAVILGLFILVDLVLLGVWLWRGIRTK